MQPYLHSLTYILEPCCRTSSKAPSPTISNMGNPSLDILRQSLPEAVAISFEIMQLETSGHKLPASRVVVHPCPSEGAGLEQQEKVQSIPWPALIRLFFFTVRLSPFCKDQRFLPGVLSQSKIGSDASSAERLQCGFQFHLGSLAHSSWSGTSGHLIC